LLLGASEDNHARLSEYHCLAIQGLIRETQQIAVEEKTSISNILAGALKDWVTSLQNGKRRRDDTKISCGRAFKGVSEQMHVS
jgi:hypothetical protein